MTDTKKLVEVEHIKLNSRHLRGTIAEGLEDRTTGALADDDTQLTKFHGFYQQDDRDLRAERKAQKLEPLFSFMLRARVPGGVVTPAQWLLVDDIARRLTLAGTLRLTTRQTFQFHGILKHNLKPVIKGMYQELIDAIAACGDVNRNVLSNTNPSESELHQSVYQDAVALSEHLLPSTNAYAELWLDGKKVNTNEESEPVYGKTYLPRKFKTAFAIPPENDVDVYANDMGFVAIAEEGEVIGYNVIAGGGMGSTHGDKATYPRLASEFGYIKRQDLLVVAEAIVTTQRDHGDRTNRKHARLKYTLDDMGVDAFKLEVQKRSGVIFSKERLVTFDSHSDRFGWTKTASGKWNLTLYVENGRLKDYPERQLMTGMKEIAKVLDGEIRMTATQNIIIANVDERQKEEIDALANRYGLQRQNVSQTREVSMACVALPTCSLAMAEAERYLPDLLTEIESLQQKHKIAEVPIVTRMTGCPNGCARPFIAEIGLVGKGPGKYNLYLGADHTGTRLNKMYRENIGEQEILSELDGLFERFSSERTVGESFGDFTVRAKVIAKTIEGRDFHE